MNVSRATACQWVRRFQREGPPPCLTSMGRRYAHPAGWEDPFAFQDSSRASPDALGRHPRWEDGEEEEEDDEAMGDW
jgi:hypothetical protein